VPAFILAPPNPPQATRSRTKTETTGFSETIATNPAIIPLGVPITEDKLKPSEDVAALGLKMLRIAPTNVTPQVLADMAQIGYGDYLVNFPAFVYSLVLRN